MSDLIDRQAAIDAVSRGCQEFRGIFAECEKNLNELPSAQPEIMFDDVRAYCEKRNLVVITDEMYKSMTNQFSVIQPTTEQIQKMQDIEQAEIEKAYELGKAEAEKELIIRCKDCKWSDANEIGDLSECNHLRGLVNASPNGYCNFAERRTDD